MTGQTWDVGIVGAGYVGVPLAQTFADAGRRVLLVDAVQGLVDALNRGESHIEDVPSDVLRPLLLTDPALARNVIRRLCALIRAERAAS